MTLCPSSSQEFHLPLADIAPSIKKVSSQDPVSYTHLDVYKRQAKVLVDELFRLRGFDVTMAEHAASILGLPGEGSRMPGPEFHGEPGRFAEKWDGRDKLTAREIEVLALSLIHI